MSQLKQIKNNEEDRERGRTGEREEGEEERKWLLRKGSPDENSDGTITLSGEEEGRRSRSRSRSPPLKKSGSRRRVNAVTRRVIDDDSDTDSGDSYETVVSEKSDAAGSSLGKVRKRGRPPTTGEYIKVAKAKRMLREEKKREWIDEMERRLTDPAVPPVKPSRGSKSMPTEADLEREFREEPTASLGDLVNKYAEEVERIAGGSRNLHGTFVRRLRLAANAIRAATAELSARTEATAPAATLERENQQLRDEIRSLKERMEALERAHMPPPPPVMQPRSSSLERMVVDDTPPPLPPPSSPGKEARERETAPPTDSRGKTLSAEGKGNPHDDLVTRLGGLIDKRLAEFRQEILAPRSLTERLEKARWSPPTSTARPPATEWPTPAEANVGRKKKKKRNGQPTNSSMMDTQSESEPAGPGRPAEKEAARREKRSTTRPLSAASEGEWELVSGRRTSARKDGIAAITNPTPAPKARAENKAAGKMTSATPKTSKVGKDTGAPSKNGQVCTFAAVAAKPAKAKAPASRAGKNLPEKKPSTQGGKAAQKPKLGRAPRTAAVVLTIPSGSQRSYAEVMREARQKVTIAEVGITDLRPRRAKTGGLILEVPGPEKEEKAKELASRLRAVLGESVKVSHPGKTAELRVGGLDDSITPVEVAEAIAAAGGCPVDEIKTGEVRRSTGGMGTVWVRCPLQADDKVEAAGKVRVGWITAKVEVLRARPLQCYRCLEVGHVVAQCKADVDRGDRCYNCGVPGHRAAGCDAAPRCPLCADLGRPATHRLGSKSCAPPSKRRRKGVSAATAGPDGAERGQGGSTVEGEAPPPTANDDGRAKDPEMDTT